MLLGRPNHHKHDQYFFEIVQYPRLINQQRFGHSCVLLPAKRLEAKNNSTHPFPVGPRQDLACIPTHPNEARRQLF
jgi:hypothetical protein